jgi:hypothetical protein
MVENPHTDFFLDTIRVSVSHLIDETELAGRGSPGAIRILQKYKMRFGIFDFHGFRFTGAEIGNCWRGDIFSVVR